MDEQAAVRAWDDDLSSLPDDQRAAIRYADALMTSPDDIDDRLVAELRGLFSEAQLIELTLKILKFNMQKATVACGHDRWITPESFAATGFGHNGWFTHAAGE